MTRDEIIATLRAVQARTTRTTIVRRILDEAGRELFRFERETQPPRKYVSRDYTD